jgi:hypothetical protein
LDLVLDEEKKATKEEGKKRDGLDFEDINFDDLDL